MYCISCGSWLPNEAQFCPRCGKRNGAEAAASRFAAIEPVSADESEANLSSPPSETNTGADGTAPPIGDEGSEAHQSASEARDTDGPSEAATGATVIEKRKSPARFANAGSITLGVAALICVVLGVVQGFIPIFLIEGVAFAGLAWLCAAKWPLRQSLHSVVLVGSLLIAGLAGVTLDQDTFGPRYRYLSQGPTELRVDEKAGRTDRLGSSGWHPVAFDKAAEQLPSSDFLAFDFALKDGHWGPNWPSGNEICFTFENPSGYVIKTLSVQIEVKDKDGKEAKDASQIVGLAREGGGLIDTGETSRVCAPAPGNFPEGGNWSYTYVGAYGWKR